MPARRKVKLTNRRQQPMHHSVDMRRHFSDLLTQHIDVDGHLHLCTLHHEKTLSPVFSTLSLNPCAAKARQNESFPPTHTNSSRRAHRSIASTIYTLIADTKILATKITSTQIEQIFLAATKKIRPKTGRNTARSHVTPHCYPQPPTYPRRVGGASGYTQAPIYAAARPAAVHTCNHQVATSGPSVSRPFTGPLLCAVLGEPLVKPPRE